MTKKPAPVSVPVPFTLLAKAVTRYDDPQLALVWSRVPALLDAATRSDQAPVAIALETLLKDLRPSVSDEAEIVEALDAAGLEAGDVLPALRAAHGADGVFIGMALAFAFMNQMGGTR
jgi:hypothetical protein